MIRLGALEIDILQQTVRAGSAELHLTALEQSLLYLLAANAGRVLTRQEILDTLWGPDHPARDDRTLMTVRPAQTRPGGNGRRTDRRRSSGCRAGC